MAQSPSFDISKMSTADKILGGAGILFFIFTFFAWQSIDLGPFDVTFSAWEGNGGALGTLAAIASILLVVWVTIQVLGVTMNLGIPAATVTAGLAGLTVLLGLIKFLVVVTKDPGFGAFVGLILLLALGYGAYMKWQESQATALPPPAPPAAPPTPPPVG